MNATIETLCTRPVDTRFNLAPDSRSFTCKMIEPGLVNYKDHEKGGLELLRKETIDKCIHTVLGNPLTRGHVLVTAENRLDEENGIVQGWHYNAQDGWYYVRGTADTPEAQIEMKVKRPSCGYRVTSFGPGGMYHGIRYDREITGIEFNHLAIVDKPRYEESSFRLNSVSNPNTNTMNLFKFLKKLVTRENGADGKPVESTKIESSEVAGNTEVEVDGKPVSLNQLAETWRKNNAPAPVQASGDDEIEIDGKPVKVSDLVTCYRTNSAKAPATPPVAPAAPAASGETEEQKKAREDAEKQRNNSQFFTLSAARTGTPKIDGGYATNSGSLAEKVQRGKERY